MATPPATWRDAIHEAEDEWIAKPCPDDLARTVRAGVLEAFARLRGILSSCPLKCIDLPYLVPTGPGPCAACSRKAAHAPAPQGRPKR